MLFKLALLIEDDKSHSLLIQRAFRQLVEQCKVAGSVAEGFELLSELEPDIIISDLHLPDSESVSHIEKLSMAAPNVPIVVLTSSSSVNDAVQAMRLGAKDFIVKNFDENFSELLRLSLSRVLSQQLIEVERLRLEREILALKTAIDSSQDGLAVASRSAEILYSNTSFRGMIEFLGGDLESASYIFSKRVVDHAAKAIELDSKMKSLASGAVWSSEIDIVGQKDVAFELSLSVFRPQGGSIDKCILWLRDITERRKREKFQRDLLSTTTHDLKGPLGTISLCAEMLIDSIEQSGKVHDLVLRVASAARGGINLIDEFLSARRIEEGSLILRPGEYDICELITTVVDDYKSPAAARKIKVECVLPEEACQLKIDRLAISRVLSNLLSNAIKFTPIEGQVSVELSVGPANWQLRISDSGCGMEPAQVQKLFSRFSRLDQHKNIEGTGLGLFIVKSIVSAHGGKIDVVSNKGEGTTFVVVVPKDPPINERGELVSLADT